MATATTTNSTQDTLALIGRILVAYLFIPAGIGKLMFRFELAYGGVFRILNVPKENLHPLIMIECPRLLFPFARESIATSVRDGGFPPLMLDPVDFVGLYRQNLERQAAAQAAQGKPS